MGNTVISTATAKNWFELAHALQVSVRAIQNWRSNPKYQETIPRDGSKGEKDVGAWRNFLVLHGLKESVLEDEDGEAPIKFIPGNESEYKKLLTYEKIKQSQIETGKMQGVLLEAAQLEVHLGAAFIAITNRVSGLAETLAPLVVARDDVAEIMDIIRPETDSILAGLNCGDYLSSVNDLADRIECTAAERDRLVELAELLLRGIGRAAIDVITQPTVIDPISGHWSIAQTAPEADV
jgi:hypothetical protein